MEGAKLFMISLVYSILIKVTSSCFTKMFFKAKFGNEAKDAQYFVEKRVYKILKGEE